MFRKMLVHTEKWRWLPLIVMDNILVFITRPFALLLAHMVYPAAIVTAPQITPFAFLVVSIWHKLCHFISSLRSKECFVWLRVDKVNEQLNERNNMEFLCG